MPDTQQLQKNIEALTPRILSGDQKALDEARTTVWAIMECLDRGTLRVATQEADGNWTTHAWIKQAILFYFRLAEMTTWEVGPFTFYDKIPLKKNYVELKVRVVPPATARYGSFMEPGVILMPSYVNIGAWVGQGTMVDTWATVGSCAQIGAMCTFLAALVSAASWNHPRQLL